MKKWLSLLSIGGIFAVSLHTVAEKRFSREVIKVSDPQSYSFFKLDDNNIPSLTQNGITTSSLVYRGTIYYYVEIGISNKTTSEIAVPMDSVSFNKPNYMVMRADPIGAANELASAANARFVPTPPPVVPPTTTTTYNGTATTYGNQTQVYGTATTTANDSGQAGANFGNVLGNAIAARRFYKAQSEAVSFSHFLATFAQTSPIVVKPGETRLIVYTFQQIKHKKAPFDVQVQLAGQIFMFRYKE